MLNRKFIGHHIFLTMSCFFIWGGGVIILSGKQFPKYLHVIFSNLGLLYVIFVCFCVSIVAFTLLQTFCFMLVSYEIVFVMSDSCIFSLDIHVIQAPIPWHRGGLPSYTRDSGTRVSAQNQFQGQMKGPDTTHVTWMVFQGSRTGLITQDYHQDQVKGRDEMIPALCEIFNSTT